MKTTEKVILYARPDDVEHLINELSKDCTIVKVFERVKGMVKIQMREIMDYLKENDIRTVIVKDCSTISRKIADFLMTLNDFCEEKINVRFIDYNIDSLLPIGKVNPTFRCACKILDEFDTIRIEETRNRLRKGYIQFIKDGGQVGRPAGFRKKNISYLLEYDEELAMLRDGVPISKISKLTGTSATTLRKLKRLYF